MNNIMGIMQSNDPRALRAQDEHVQKMFDNSLSRNTRINYKCRIDKFLMAGYKLPASPSDIVAFLNVISKKVKPTTVNDYTKALRYWHKINDFIDPTTDAKVQRFLLGIKKTYGESPHKAKPFTIEDMTRIHGLLSSRDDFNSVRNDALFLLGFFGAFRRSELVTIKFEHLIFSEEGLQILLPKSKTDQTGKGQTIWIPYLKDLCPIKSLNKWLEKSGIVEGFIWPPVAKYRVLRPEHHITSDTFYYLIKEIVKETELPDPNAYSAHSLRRGFATEASKRGITLSSLMKHGRWESVQVAQGYIDQANNFQENALNLFNT